jgi:hypothetical protein
VKDQSYVSAFENQGAMKKASEAKFIGAYVKIPGLLPSEPNALPFLTIEQLEELAKRTSDALATARQRKAAAEMIKAGDVVKVVAHAPVSLTSDGQGDVRVPTGTLLAVLAKGPRDNSMFDENYLKVLVVSGGVRDGIVRYVYANNVRRASTADMIANATRSV